MKTSSIPKIPAKISQFIEINSILSLATVINNKPYCSNCFYYFWKKEYTLIIKSFIETRHIREALVNPYVAGTIYYDSSKMDLVRGIQYTGLLYHIAGEQTKIVLLGPRPSGNCRPRSRERSSLGRRDCADFGACARARRLASTPCQHRPSRRGSSKDRKRTRQPYPSSPLGARRACARRSLGPRPRRPGGRALPPARGSGPCPRIARRGGPA